MTSIRPRCSATMSTCTILARAVEDGATVPIYYESRLARIELPPEELPVIDAEIDGLTEDETMR